MACPPTTAASAWGRQHWWRSAASMTQRRRTSGANRERDREHARTFHCDEHRGTGRGRGCAPGRSGDCCAPEVGTPLRRRERCAPLLLRDGLRGDSAARLALVGGRCTRRDLLSQLSSRTPSKLDPVILLLGMRYPSL